MNPRASFRLFLSQRRPLQTGELCPLLPRSIRGYQISLNTGRPMSLTPCRNLTSHQCLDSTSSDLICSGHFCENFLLHQKALEETDSPLKGSHCFVGSMALQPFKRPGGEPAGSQTLCATLGACFEAWSERGLEPILLVAGWVPNSQTLIPAKRKSQDSSCCRLQSAWPGAVLAFNSRVLICWMQGNPWTFVAWPLGI